MVAIENIDLDAKGIRFPFGRIGMVVAQPFLSLSDHEPFKCRPEAAAAQLAMIRKTLEIAKQNPHGQAKTHFTIFPEYSIPGLAGITLITELLSEAAWPAGTVVIGGVDALTKQEYATLAAQPDTFFNAAGNAPGLVDDANWINLAVIWAKGADGTVEKWLQPKLHPAWAEQNIAYNEMFEGKSIYIFQGKLENDLNYRFSILTCFDWIATVDTKLLWLQVLEDLQRQSQAVGGAEVALSWFFVVQRNMWPNHHTFLSQIPPFYNEASLPSVRRDRACLVFANCAGKDRPGKAATFGGNSLVMSGQTLFEKPTCALTFSAGGTKFRNTNILAPYYDIYFREAGACIMSFAQVHPGSVQAGAANKTVAVEHAKIFAVDNIVDPRAPSGPVPASVKWLNDELDAVHSLSSLFPGAALEAKALGSHSTTVAALRLVDGGAITDLLVASTQEKVEDPDKWGNPEVGALELLVHALEALSTGFEVHPATAGKPVSSMVVEGSDLPVVTVKGLTHAGCIEHAENTVARGSTRLLVVTKDRENTPWDKREGNFLARHSVGHSKEGKITDPAGNVIHVAYQDLLTIFRTSANENEVMEAVRAKFV